MAELFGFEFKKKQVEDQVDASLKLPIDELDGTTTITHSAGSAASYQMTIDPTWKSEGDLIQHYRDMSLQQAIDKAIEEIITDAIVIDLKQPVAIDFSEETKLSEPIRKKIVDEFDEVMKLLNFKEDGHFHFRDFYIDGRLAMFKVVDPQNIKRGIIDVQKLDVKNLKKVRKIKTRKEKNVEVYDSVEESFVYSQKADAQNNNMFRYMLNRTEMRIKPEAVAYITSGLVDKQNNWVISYLHKAIRPANHLRLLEDASLIYDLARAPERRVFYIDVGNLPRARAEEYLRDVMNKYRNKITYDAKTGDIKDDRRAMSVLEDFWLPRRDGGKGTEISTLPGGTNNNVEKMEYFKKNLYDALGIPQSRLESQNGFSLGRSTEISRDEVRFSSFIDKLRVRFSGLFYDLLRTNLILKGIITPQDWEQVEHDSFFKFESNVLFAEMKEAEIIQQRIANLQQVEPFVGKYFSKRWVQKNVLFLTDNEIEEMEKDVGEEIKSGKIADPNAQPEES